MANLSNSQLTGVVLGDRVTEVVGNMRFTDVANGLECVLQFNPNRKLGVEGMFQGKTVSDLFRGIIVKKSGKKETAAHVIKRSPSLQSTQEGVEGSSSKSLGNLGGKDEKDYKSNMVSAVKAQVSTSPASRPNATEDSESEALTASGAPGKKIFSPAAVDKSMLEIAQKKLAEGKLTKDEFNTILHAHNATRVAENLNQSSFHDMSGFDDFQEQALHTVEGSWLDNLVCVGDISVAGQHKSNQRRIIWDMHRDCPSELLFQQQYLAGEILPSDSRHRKDILALLEKGDISIANQVNAELIESQNNDEKLRAKGKPAETLIKSFFS